MYRLIYHCYIENTKCIYMFHSSSGLFYRNNILKCHKEINLHTICKILLLDVKPDGMAKNGWNSIQFSTNPIHNSFYHPFHSPSHYQCSNVLVSASETNEFQFMIQFSKHPKRPSGSQWTFIQAKMSIEMEIDISFENYWKKFLFILEYCIQDKNTDNIQSNLFFVHYMNYSYKCAEYFETKFRCILMYVFS